MLAATQAATQAWSAARSATFNDPSAFAWLFYVGFLVLVGGMGALLATLISFGGVERNGPAQIALSVYLFVVGAAFLVAPMIWSATGQGETDLGIVVVGMAVEITPVVLVAGYLLVPAEAQSPWPPLLTLAISAALAVTISLVYVIVGFSVAFLFLSGLPALPAVLATVVQALPLIVPALMLGAVLAVEPERAQRALTHLRATWHVVLGGTALVLIALLRSGPDDWSQPPRWGSDLLLLSLLAGIGVFSLTRRLRRADTYGPEEHGLGVIGFLRSWGRHAAHLPRVRPAAVRAAARARARRPSIPALLRRVVSGARR